MSTIAIVEFGGNFRPILDRIISYPNPKLTCYAKNPVSPAGVMALGRSFGENKIFGGIFFSYRHLIFFAKSFLVILSSENIYV